TGDEIGKRFLICWKVATCRLFVGGLGVVDQVSEELPGARLVLCEVPHHRAIGDIRKCEYARMPNQRRSEPDLGGDVRFLLLRNAQQAERIDRGGGLAREHGLDVARWAPGKLVRCSRIFVEGLGVFQRLDGESGLGDRYISSGIENMATESV